MSRISFGLIKAGLFNSLTESLNKNDEFQNSDCIEFFSIVKETPFLQLESIFYKNLLDKTIKGEDSAIRYMDENINLFRSFGKTDYKKAHDKLSIYLTKIGHYKPSNISLINAIDTLLFESLASDVESIHSKDAPNIDALHDAYEVVLAHIKKDKETLASTSSMTGIKQALKEGILKSAISKFNEKYSHLNENDKNLLRVVINPDNKAKKELFESLKKDAYEKLSKSLESATQAVNDRIKQSIEKLDKMKFDEVNSTKDIIKLHNLKKSI